MSSPLLEHDYSSETTAAIITMAEESVKKQSSSPPADLNMKATELRLAPPGSESPERWLSSGDGVGGGKNKSGLGLKDVGVGSSVASEKKPLNRNSSAAAVRASKVEAVVGWPPIRSFRKNITNPPPPPKPLDKAEDAGCLYVKVSMDGAPYLRKLDLNTYGSYAHLSVALHSMFSCFSIGENGSMLKDHQSWDKCILTYEDKDGDWMLVGDVPWDMFVNTCKKLRITKPTEPIGSAPRALQKCSVDAE